MKRLKALICCITAVAASIGIVPSPGVMSDSSDITVVHAADQMYSNVNSDGSYHELWNQNFTGTAEADFDDDGKFRCSWDSVKECLFRSGHKFGGKKNYDDYDTLSLSYEAEIEVEGESRLCLTGWTESPFTVFYVIDAWTTEQRPLEDKEPVASVTSDGKVYDIYHLTYYIAPSLISQPFQEYWSVARTNAAENTSKIDISGTINLTNHFNAWVEAGFEPGLIEDISLDIECYDSSGKADIKRNVLTGYNLNSSNDDRNIPSETESSSLPDTTDSESPDVTAPDTVVSGDIDNNGAVNAADLVRLIQYLLGKTALTADQQKSADLNNDGRITVIDYIKLKSILI